MQTRAWSAEHTLETHRDPLPPFSCCCPTPLTFAACCAQLRYANNSQYKNDTMIRKEVYCSPAVLEELKRIIADSEARQWAYHHLPSRTHTRLLASVVA